MFLIVNQCHKQAFNSPSDACVIYITSINTFGSEHMRVFGVFHLRVMCIFMQDSVIFFHDMSWCKLVHLCKRAFYSYSTDIDTSSRCLGTHRCRYFTNRKLCSWFITFKYMVNMWLEYNNRTSTDMPSVDEV